MKGRVVVVAPEAAQRLAIYWRQNQQDFEILLTATLGASVARLVSEGDLHYLDIPGEARQFAESPAQLLFQATGLNLPLESLAPVLRGQKRFGNIGGWQVSTLATDTFGRPQRVEAYRDGVTIKLTVTEWL
jgi:outer membrane biogenesis lipoprotein LolB